jgi:hypothetical protein
MATAARVAAVRAREACMRWPFGGQAVSRRRQRGRAGVGAGRSMSLPPCAGRGWGAHWHAWRPMAAVGGPGECAWAGWPRTLCPQSTAAQPPPAALATAQMLLLLLQQPPLSLPHSSPACSSTCTSHPPVQHPSQPRATPALGPAWPGVPTAEHCCTPPPGSLAAPPGCPPCGGRCMASLGSWQARQRTLPTERCAAAVAPPAPSPASVALGLALLACSALLARTAFSPALPQPQQQQQQQQQQQPQQLQQAQQPQLAAALPEGSDWGPGASCQCPATTPPCAAPWPTCASAQMAPGLPWLALLAAQCTAPRAVGGGAGASFPGRQRRLPWWWQQWPGLAPARCWCCLAPAAAVQCLLQGLQLQLLLLLLLLQRQPG